MEELCQISANSLRHNQELQYGQVAPAPKPHKPARQSKRKEPRASKQPLDGRKSLEATQAGSGLSKANYELALKNIEKKSNRFYKGEELGITTDIEYFKKYGPGVSLFFQFQLSLIKTFLLMALISLVPTIYNYIVGPVMSTKGSSLAYYISSTTIGNFSTTDSSYTQMNKYVNVIADMVLMLVFIIFYFYWLHKGQVITEEIRSQVKLKSYNVLQLVEFPAKATVEQVEAFMGQFGTVMEVAAVMNYNETIALSRKIFEEEIELRKLKLEKNKSPSTKIDQKIKETETKIDQLYKQLVLYEDEIKQEVIMYYITFSSLSEKVAAVNILTQNERSVFGCCGSDTPQNLLLCGQNVKVKSCHTEPGEIIWQNQHITWSTRWLRILIQYVLLIAAIAVGFVAISFLNILVPSSSSSVDTSNYTSTTIQSETNTTIVQSWCIANQVSVLQQGSSASIYTYCWDYIFESILKNAIIIGIAIGIVLIKFILKHFVIFLSQFRRYKTHAEQSKSMIINLFFVYISTTVVITLIIQANLLSISFKSIITYLVSNDTLKSNAESMSEYSDFISDWYVSIGYQILFNAIILVFHPALSMPIFYCFNQKIARCRAQGQQIQAQMEKKMMPEEFEIESDYAEILSLIFMCLAFCGSMPVITIISFFALCLRYLYEKHYFFRYCRIPKTFDEALDTQISSLIPYAIIIHFCFSIWMFGATEIFAFDSSVFSNLTTSSDSGFINSVQFILERVFGTYYYSIFFVLFLVIWIFKKILFDWIAKRFMEDPKSHKTIPTKISGKASTGDSFGPSTFVSSKSLTESYKIENNPDYSQILEIMQKKRKFIVMVKGFPKIDS